MILMEIGISIASLTTIMTGTCIWPDQRNMQMVNRNWKLQEGMTEDGEVFDIEAAKIYDNFFS